jgi:hypothetical protein
MKTIATPKKQTNEKKKNKTKTLDTQSMVEQLRHYIK